MLAAFAALHGVVGLSWRGLGPRMLPRLSEPLRIMTDIPSLEPGACTWASPRANAERSPCPLPCSGDAAPIPIPSTGGSWHRPPRPGRGRPNAPPASPVAGSGAGQHLQDRNRNQWLRATRCRPANLRAGGFSRFRRTDTGAETDPLLRAQGTDLQQTTPEPKPKPTEGEGLLPFELLPFAMCSSSKGQETASVSLEVKTKLSGPGCILHTASLR